MMMVNAKDRTQQTPFLPSSLSPSLPPPPSRAVGLTDFMGVGMMNVQAMQGRDEGDDGEW